jgi:hypothetical protein
MPLLFLITAMQTPLVTLSILASITPTIPDWMRRRFHGFAECPSEGK